MRRFLAFYNGFMFGLLVLWAFHRSWGAPAQHYTLTDLGPQTVPAAIDPGSATSVGYQDIPPPLGNRLHMASVFTSQATQLGTLPGGNWSLALGTCGGFIVGESSTGPTARFTHAFEQINGGALRDLGTASTPELFSAATDVNCVGNAAGYGTLTQTAPVVPLMWIAGQVHVLPTLQGIAGVASTINEAGDLAGNSQMANNTLHCTFWPVEGGIVDCHTRADIANSEAIQMNETPEIVGQAGGIGFAWTAATGQRLLAPLPGDTASSAFGINSAGDKVGSSARDDSPPSAFHQTAVLWDANDQPHDLLPLSTNNAGWVFVAAVGINDAGAIVGKGFLNGEPHGFLLTPQHPPTPIAPPLPAPVADDFNGDGKTDLLWQNQLTGAVVAWMLEGTTVHDRGVIASEVDAPWQIAGVGDLDGDGKADLLWRHRRTGEVVVWLMNGSTRRSGTSLAPSSDPTWQIVGLGDVDGDRKADVLWHNTRTGALVVWFMDGSTVRSSGTLAPSSDVAWQVAGLGDLDGDGKADVLWQHRDTGAVVAWLLDGATVRSTGLVASAADVAWEIVGLGDVDGDHKADVLWHHRETGATVAWLMNGTTKQGSTVLASGADPAWQIATVGDVDGDGTADLIWQHADTGAVVLWLLQGGGVKDRGVIAVGADASWRLAAQ